MSDPSTDVRRDASARCRAARALRLGAVAALALPLAAAAAPPAGCPDRDPQRRVLFGDLHVHTAVSADARLFGTTNRPADAYRFARGEAIEIRAPMGDDSRMPARLARPLDFTAVTDHAESLGAVSLCTTPGSPAWDLEPCRRARQPLAERDLALMSAHISRAFDGMRSPELCGADGSICAAAARTPWRETQEAAAAWNEPCRFTTFVAFEYSPTPDQAKVHRNVIFRGAEVIDLPIAWMDEPDVVGLWRRLRRECSDAGTGCDVLAIPHNSNLSNGRMFRPVYGDQTDPARQAEIARLRSAMEPLVEIFQFKGDSECRNGLWNVLGATDELCAHEKFRDWGGAQLEDCRDGFGSGALGGRGCVSRRDYVRFALAEGLAEQRRIGANPHRFGLIGSTDAHDGTAGDTEEWVRDGELRPIAPLEHARNSSGGLAAVWAEENTRDSIFDAMQRRETYATSGPRMSVRLFGGWGFGDDVCDAPDLVARGYRDGVPMGGELAARPDGAAPAFVVSALRDPGVSGHPGGLLQRAQIVKVWAGEGDAVHHAVYDAAGGPNDASVDASCAPRGEGAAHLCGVWRDPDFDPSIDAAYYARVLENPSCRHSALACARLDTAARAAAGCDDPSIPRVQQERAWTAPIWYGPED